MSKYIKHSIKFLSLLLCFSCAHNNNKQKLNIALHLAADNKNELEIVLHHYQEESLKLKAAVHLIHNMAMKYTAVSEDLSAYDTLFSGIANLKKENRLKRDYNQKGIFPKVTSIWDSIESRAGPLHKAHETVELDLTTISADFLIENIDLAFAAWEFPWTNHLSFDEFCKYILPYRVSDERLSSWRPQVLARYQQEIDSLVQNKVTDPVEVGMFFDSLLSAGWESNRIFLEYPFAMTYDQLSKTEMGLCLQESQYAVFVMRAVGVPVVRVSIPHYGNRSLGHEFDGIRTKSGKIIDFQINDEEPGEVINGIIGRDFKMPKIFVRNYAIHDSSLYALTSGEVAIPALFTDPGLEDVTGEFIPVSDIALDHLDKLSQISDYLYLCVFDNQNWQAVQWSEIKNDKAVFKDMGRGIVYMPMIYMNRHFKAIRPPILLGDDGQPKMINPVNQPEELTLHRKNPVLWKGNIKNMVGGTFQLSNEVRFEGSKEVYKMDNPIRLIYHTIDLPDDEQKYRYVRYLFPDSSGGNIAELEYLGKNDRVLDGKIIADPVTVNEGGIQNVFDHDVLSFIRV